MGALRSEQIAGGGRNTLDCRTLQGLSATTVAHFGCGAVARSDRLRRGGPRAPSSRSMRAAGPADHDVATRRAAHQAGERVGRPALLRRPTPALGRLPRLLVGERLVRAGVAQRRLRGDVRDFAEVDAVGEQMPDRRRRPEPAVGARRDRVHVASELADARARRRATEQLRHCGGSRRIRHQRPRAIAPPSGAERAKRSIRATITPPVSPASRRRIAYRKPGRSTFLRSSPGRRATRRSRRPSVPRRR
jgi:hypothetical protein